MPSPADFNRALDEFLAYVNEIQTTHRQNNYPNASPSTITAMHGQRYVRLVSTDANGSSRSAYGFVDKTNGDLLKSAGWSAPAKHARGNIFDKSTWKAAGPYGFAYLK